jgi:hypothetical protein
VLDGAPRLPGVLTAPTVPVVTHQQLPPLTNGATSGHGAEPAAALASSGSANTRMLVGVAIGFLVLGVVLALVLMKLIAKG